MTDITERLRDGAKNGAMDIGSAWALMDEAADEIDRLRARVADLERESEIDKAVRDSIADDNERYRAQVAYFDEQRTGLMIALELRDARIDRLRARVAELEAADGICFTAMLVEIDGHAYGLRPGAARIVREALRATARVAEFDALRQKAAAIDKLARSMIRDWGRRDEAGYRFPDTVPLIISTRDACAPDDLVRQILGWADEEA